MKLPSIFVALLCIVAFPIFTLEAAHADEAAPVISNLKYGLVCGPSSNRRVCFQTDVIPITNESSCIYNRRSVDCTWYGYSYDYIAASDVTINCEYVTDTIQNVGNPNKSLMPTSKTEAKIMLRAGQHHFSLLQYTFGENGPGVPKQVIESCLFNGAPLFSITFQYEWADKTAPVESVPDMNHVR